MNYTNTEASAQGIVEARWDAHLSHPDGVDRWLRRMYYSEIGATASLANQLGNPNELPTEFFDGLHRILLDETRHALMVAQVARARGCWPPAPKSKPGSKSPLDIAVNPAPFAQAAWVDLQAEAEAVRRLTAVVQHTNTPEDVRRLAKALLKDEALHVEFFRQWASQPDVYTFEAFRSFATKAWGHCVTAV